MPDQPAHPARHLVLAAVLTLGLLALAAGPALAQPLGCGAVVAQDTTLTSDLLDCPGNGLVVGADGITVDLNGHTISGQIISGGSPDQVGIENRGHDDVTIRNGTVTFFGRGGVLLVGVDRNRVQALTMDFFGEFSIQLEGGGSANRFTGNHLDRPGEVGISIVGAAAASRDNNLDRPGFIGVDDSGTRTVTTANLIVGQVYPDLPTGGIAPIIVREEASDGRIQANVVRRHGPGIGVDTGRRHPDLRRRVHRGGQRGQRDRPR